MGKAKKAEKYRLVLPEKSWFLVAAAICATVGLLLKAVGISTERGEFIVGIPCFVNLQVARDNSYFIRYLGGDILALAAGVLTIAAPLVKWNGLRLLAAAELLGVVQVIWVYLTSALDTASGFEGNISAFVVIAAVLIGVIFVVLTGAASVVCAVSLLLCDAGRLRNKKTLLIVISVCLGLGLLAFVGNLFLDSADYGSFSVGMIVLYKVYSAVSLLIDSAPVILMALSLEVRFEK